MVTIKIKIERLPSVRPRLIVRPPEKTRDGVFTTRELEDLAERLRLWTVVGKWELPALPFLSTAQFDLEYNRMFCFDSYSSSIKNLLLALYPAGPHLFVIDPKKNCSTWFTPARICPRGEEDWVYWPGELIPTEEWEWCSGFRGPLDEVEWADNPIRGQLEKELLIMSIFLFARAAASRNYNDRLFVTAPGWPLIIRVR